MNITKQDVLDILHNTKVDDPLTFYANYLGDSSKYTCKKNGCHLDWLNNFDDWCDMLGIEKSIKAFVFMGMYHKYIQPNPIYNGKLRTSDDILTKRRIDIQFAVNHFLDSNGVEVND